MVFTVKRWMPLVSLLTISIVAVTVLFVAHARTPAQEFEPPTSLTDDEPGANEPAYDPATPAKSQAQDASLDDQIAPTTAQLAHPPNAPGATTGPANPGYATHPPTLPATSPGVAGSYSPATANTNGYPYFTPATPQNFQPTQTSMPSGTSPWGPIYSNPNATPPPVRPSTGASNTNNQQSTCPVPCADCQVPCTDCQNPYAARQNSYAANQSPYASSPTPYATNQSPYASQPTGDTWERKVGPCSSSLSGIGGNLLRGELVGPDFRVVYTAEYSTTQDSVMYGVLQSVTIQEGTGGETAELEHLLDLESLSNSLIDQPFSARVRSDGNQLILKDVKFAGLDLQEDEEELTTIMRTVVIGTYTKRMAAPVPMLSLIPYPTLRALVPGSNGVTNPPAPLPQATNPYGLPQTSSPYGLPHTTSPQSAPYNPPRY